MLKRIIYLAYMLILLTSCEEYYTPIIDTIDGQLVVEALVTNVPSKNYVRLTRTSGFYNTMPPEPVTGARVELVEINGKVVSGNESNPGNFTFNTVPAVGKNYKLRIMVRKDTYESEVITMPPIPAIERFYTGHKESKQYIPDSYGIPIAYNIQRREIYIDAPATISLSHYRFDVRSVLQWTYDSLTTGPPIPTTYGWFSYYSKANFNLAGPKKFTGMNKIEKHPIFMLPYNAQEYLVADSLIAHGWIIIIEQYGTSVGSFNFHEKLNSQFAANGSLFDPVQTQVYGNITCTTDPSKIVFGYFDLNSYQQIRYFMNLYGPDNPIIIRQIFRFPTIPEEGTTIGLPPDWWE